MFVVFVWACVCACVFLFFFCVWVRAFVCGLSLLPLCFLSVSCVCCLTIALIRVRLFVFDHAFAPPPLQAAEVERLQQQLAEAETKGTASTKASASEIETLRERTASLEAQLKQTADERDALAVKLEQQVAALQRDKQLAEDKVVAMQRRFGCQQEVCVWGGEGVLCVWKEKRAVQKHTKSCTTSNSHTHTHVHTHTCTHTHMYTHTHTLWESKLTSFQFPACVVLPGGLARSRLGCSAGCVCR